MRKKLCLIFLFIGLLFAKEMWSTQPVLPELKTIKTGLLAGIQKSNYFGIELGMERQWKELKLRKPLTWAISGVGEYQFQANNLGIKIGPWAKFGRLNFTYGVYGAVLSDFSYTRIGITPAIGFKIIGFHIQTGYNALAGPKVYTDYNKLFLSLRYYISKDRKFDWKSKGKKD